MATAALVAGPAVAADIPDPYIEIPEVDYGLGGSFYLRGSAGFLVAWAKEKVDPVDAATFPVLTLGYGYSWGGGFGYETGNGLRFDVTMDSVEHAGLSITKPPADPNPGTYTLMLRSTVALANVYYDFGFGGGGGFGYTGEGGAFGYVGAGAGLAYNHSEVNSPPGTVVPVPSGSNVSLAAAGMVGVGYDMGSWVADLGYRAIWIQQMNNWPTDQTTNSYYYVNNLWTHELRGTVRYRFN
jgi:hypothetical protein